MEKGFQAKQAADDTNTLIVNTTIEVAKFGALAPTVSDDIDLKVMLTVSAAPEEMFLIKLEK